MKYIKLTLVIMSLILQYRGIRCFSYTLYEEHRSWKEHSLRQLSRTWCIQDRQ